MKKMKRIVALALMLVMVGGLLTGCGGKKEKDYMQAVAAGLLYDWEEDSGSGIRSYIWEHMQNGQVLFSIFNYSGSLAYNKEMHYGKDEEGNEINKILESHGNGDEIFQWGRLRWRLIA